MVQESAMRNMHIKADFGRTPTKPRLPGRLPRGLLIGRSGRQYYDVTAPTTCTPQYSELRAYPKYIYKTLDASSYPPNLPTARVFIKFSPFCHCSIFMAIIQLF